MQKQDPDSILNEYYSTNLIGPLEEKLKKCFSEEIGKINLHSIGERLDDINTSIKDNNLSEPLNKCISILSSLNNQMAETNKFIKCFCDVILSGAEKVRWE